MTNISAAARPAGRRKAQGLRWRTMLLAALAAVAVAAGPVPAAGADSAGATVAESITLADLRQMVEDFEATGEVTLSGARRLGAVLSLAELYDARGFDSRTIAALELFKDTADDPVRVPSATARAALIAAADEIIVQLGGTPGG